MISTDVLVFLLALTAFIIVLSVLLYAGRKGRRRWATRLDGWFMGQPKQTPSDNIGTLLPRPKGGQLRYVQLSQLPDTGVVDLTLPPLVFCMDGPNVLENFVQELLTPQQGLPAPPLTTLGRDVIAFEPRGVGLATPGQAFDFTLRARAEDCLALLEHISNTDGHDQFVLAFGGCHVFVAQQVVALQPDIIARVIAWQAPNLKQHLAWLAARDKHNWLRQPIVGQILNYTNRHALLDLWFHHTVVDDMLRKRLTLRADFRLQERGCYCLASHLQQFAASLAAKPPPPFPKTLPVLILWGLADPSHQSSEPASSHELCENPGRDGDAALTPILELDCGHYPEFEATSAFCDHLAAFLPAS